MRSERVAAAGVAAQRRLRLEEEVVEIQSLAAEALPQRLLVAAAAYSARPPAVRAWQVQEPSQPVAN